MISPLFPSTPGIFVVLESRIVLMICNLDLDTIASEIITKMIIPMISTVVNYRSIFSIPVVMLDVLHDWRGCFLSLSVSLWPLCLLMCVTVVWSWCLCVWCLWCGQHSWRPTRRLQDGSKLLACWAPFTRPACARGPSPCSRCRVSSGQQGNSVNRPSRLSTHTQQTKPPALGAPSFTNSSAVCLHCLPYTKQHREKNLGHQVLLQPCRIL